ncbi:MAG: CHAT domain-containing protein [Methanothrix sp.]
MPPRIKTLLLASNPRDTPRIDIEKEFREIDEKIRAAKHRDFVELIPALAVRPNDLLQLFNRHEPNIVHFSGHGCKSGEIILEADNNKSDQIRGEAIKDLFQVMKGNIRVVLLNSCNSEPQAQSIAEVIDCAIGMKGLISDKAAICFAAAFYRAIGFGRSVQNSFDQAILELKLENIPEDGTPQLHTRNGVNPSEVILVKDDNNIDKEIDRVIEAGDALIRDQAFEAATREFESIFTKISPEKFPDKYIRIGNSLGIAYWCMALGRKNAETNLERAIHAYQKTLVIAKLDKYPTDFALLKNNLGNTYNLLSEYQNKALNLEKAMDAYDECFEVYTRDKYPEDFARVLSQKSNAFQSLFAMKSDAINEEYAQRQYYIGFTLLKAAMGHRDPVPAKMAIAAFMEALKVYTPNITPKEYASTSGALGTLYLILSDLEEQNKVANLHKGIQAFQNALLIYDLERSPGEYGITQQNLATTFRMLSEFTDKQDNLKKAIQANQEALRVRWGDPAQAEMLRSKIELDQKELSQRY